MKMKRFFYTITIVFVALMISSQSWAVSAKSKSIGLQKAIELGLEKDNSLKLYSEKIKIAERRHRNALTNAENISKMAWSTVDERISNKKVESLIPLQKLNIVNELKWQKEDAEKSIRVKITNQFYKLQYKNEQIELQKKNVEQVKAELFSQKEKVDKGIVTQLTLLPMELSVDNAQAALNVLENEKENLTMEFNILLGNDVMNEIQLDQQEIPNTRMEKIDVDKFSAEWLENAPSIKKIEANKMLAETEKKIYVDYSMYKTPPEIDDLEEEILNQGYSLRDEMIKIECNIRTDYNVILNKADMIDINRLSYEKAVKQLDIAKAQYNLGLINMNGFNKIVLNCDQTLLSYKSALLDYYLAVETFNNNYKISNRTLEHSANN